MPRASSYAKGNPKTWCPRCQERDASPDPKLPLLNVKHEKFARNLAIGKMTVGEAYTAAGFNARTPGMATNGGCRIKKKLAIENRIIALLEMTMDLDVKSREWVDNQLKEIVDRCMQGKPHMNGAGKPDGQWTFDAANANKALYSMGKDRGMFVEKIELGGIDKELHGKSAAQLMAMVEAAAIDLGRDFIKQLGEKVGLGYEGGGEGLPGDETTPDEPLPTLQ